MNDADNKKLDRNSLEELREQHKQSKNSLAAHQALIDGLEYHLAKIDRLNKKLVERIIKCKESLGIAEDKIIELESKSSNTKHLTEMDYPPTLRR